VFQMNLGGPFPNASQNPKVPMKKILPDDFKTQFLFILQYTTNKLNFWDHKTFPSSNQHTETLYHFSVSNAVLPPTFVAIIT
jgi:hypothetical protein